MALGHVSVGVLWRTEMETKKNFELSKNSVYAQDIIPRRSGDVVLGGYKTDNDWTSTPQAWQTTEILRRCLKLCPELVPVDRRANPAEPTVDELRKSVIQEGCGLRPARKGGVRIGWEMSSMFQRPTAVVYNYG
jgi:D-aspartate oxidase